MKSDIETILKNSKRDISRAWDEVVDAIYAMQDEYEQEIDELKDKISDLEIDKNILK